MYAVERSFPGLFPRHTARIIERDGLGAVADRQLVVKVRKVELHRVGRDTQFARQFPRTDVDAHFQIVVQLLQALVGVRQFIAIAAGGRQMGQQFMIGLRQFVERFGMGRES